MKISILAISILFAAAAPFVFADNSVGSALITGGSVLPGCEVNDECFTPSVVPSPPRPASITQPPVTAPPMTEPEPMMEDTMEPMMEDNMMDTMNDMEDTMMDEMEDTMNDMEDTMMDEMEDTMMDTMMDEGPKTYNVSNPEGSSLPGCEETNECFIPADLVINVGDTVVWTNDDAIPHTVTSGDLDEDVNVIGFDYPNGFDSQFMIAGATFEHTFEEAGMYPYFCQLHPWMVGIVNVENIGYTGSISLDREIYPIPWGVPNNFSSQNNKISIFPIHETGYGDDGFTSANTLVGDLTIHVRVNDPDFDVSTSGADVLAFPTVIGQAITNNDDEHQITTTNGESVDVIGGPIKITVSRGTDKIVLAYAGAPSDYTNLDGKIGVGDDSNIRVVSSDLLSPTSDPEIQLADGGTVLSAIKTLGGLTEISPSSGIFELDFNVTYQDGPTSTMCPDTSGDQSNRFEISTTIDTGDYCILQGDIITVEYTDPTDASGQSNTVTDSATFDLRNGALQTDKSVYIIGSDIVLTVIEPDWDLDNDAAETYSLDVIEWESRAATTTIGEHGIDPTAFDPEPTALRETGDSTGIFQVVLETPQEINDVNLDRGEEIKLEYMDWGPSSASYVGQEKKDLAHTIFTSNYGATIELDQEIYSWTDKVYISVVSPSHNFDGDLIDKIGDTNDDLVSVTTRSGGELEPYSLNETGPDTGVFTGEVILTGFLHDADGDTTTGDENGYDTNPRTSSGDAGPTNGYLSSDNDDRITVSFEFSEDETIVGTAIIRWNIGEIQWLETSYPASGSGVLRIVDPDMNLNPEAIDNFETSVWSDSDSGGISLTVTETSESTGIFEGTVQFTVTDQSFGHRLRVSEGDSVTGEYEDNTLPDPYSRSDELEITATTLIDISTGSFQDGTHITMAEGSGVPGCEANNECFIPYEVTINVGDEITWENTDTSLHFVTAGKVGSGDTGFDYPNGFDSGVMNPGDSYTIQFDEAGTYPYFCTVHPWMKGIVNVENTETGSIPPGLSDLPDIVQDCLKLTDHVWQKNQCLPTFDDTLGHRVDPNLQVSGVDGEKEYVYGDTVTLTGDIRIFREGYDVTIQILSPDGEHIGIGQITPTKIENPPLADDIPSTTSGKFEYRITAGGNLWRVDGEYKISIAYGTEIENKQELSINYKAGEVAPPALDITLNGDNPYFVAAGQYSEPGATATLGGVTVNNDSDTLTFDAVGVYTVTYTATHEGLEYTKTRTVIVYNPANFEFVNDSLVIPINSSYIPAGIQYRDGSDVYSISDNHISTSQTFLNTSTTGSYSVMFTLVDSTSRPIFSLTKSVFVYGINMTGPDVITVPQGEQYVDSPVNAVDKEGNSVSTFALDPFGVLEDSTELGPGTYPIIYVIPSDDRDLARLGEIRSITIEAPHPTITPLGDNPISIAQGDRYTDYGARAIDTVGNPIPVSVDTSGVDTDVAGTYEVVYTVTHEGVEYTDIRTVHVYGVNINGPSLQFMDSNQPYEELGAITVKPDGTQVPSTPFDLTGFSGDELPLYPGTYPIIYYTPISDPDVRHNFLIGFRLVFVE